MKRSKKQEAFLHAKAKGKMSPMMKEKRKRSMMSNAADKMFNRSTSY